MRSASSIHRSLQSLASAGWGLVLVLLAAVCSGCALGVPASEGMVFSDRSSYDSVSWTTAEYAKPAKTGVYTEFGMAASYHVYSPRFDRRLQRRYRAGDDLPPVSPEWRWDWDLLSITAGIENRVAASFNIAYGFPINGSADATVRIGGPYYVTGSVTPFGQGEVILQRRLLYRKGFGLSAGVFGRSEYQRVGTRTSGQNVRIHVAGARSAFQVPLGSSGSNRVLLRGFLGAGVETTFQTPALKFGASITYRRPGGF